MARPRLGIPTLPTGAAFGDTVNAGTVGANMALADHRHGMPADPTTAHAAAADPHTGYQKESEKDAAGGYVGIAGGTSNVNLPASVYLGAGSTDTRIRRGQAGRVLVDANGAAASTEIGIVATAGQRAKFDARAGADANARFELFGDATMAGLTLGDGTASPDTNLYRSAAATLRTDGTLVAGAGFVGPEVLAAVSVTSGAFNDYNPAGLSTAGVLKITNTGNCTITGLVAATYQQRLTILNAGASVGVIRLEHENIVDSSAANRFACPAGVATVLDPGRSVDLLYILAEARWRVLAPPVPVSIRRVYTAGTTWSKPFGLRALDVEVQAGGGGGGGAPATTGTQASAGGGAGGGGYAKKMFTAAELPASCTVTVGAAGTNGSGVDGGAGGTSSFAGSGITTVQGNGGGGGQALNANNNAGASVFGANGGASSGGDLNCGGGGGGAAFRITAGTTGGMGGAGGSSVLGGGGGAPGASTNGSPGLTYGGGGGGASNSTSQSARPGGAGGAGVVIVTEYY